MVPSVSVSNNNNERPTQYMEFPSSYMYNPKAIENEVLSDEDEEAIGLVKEDATLNKTFQWKKPLKHMNGKQSLKKS